MRTPGPVIVSPRLRALAPRLALAHAQRNAELLLERADRSRARTRVLRAIWLVEHRELQLIRAGARNDRRYVARRAAKLAAARDELALAEHHAREVGA